MAHAGTGGLQQHSIGADYPFVMVAHQRHGYAPLEWSIMDSRTGNHSQKFRTPLAARIHLNSILIRNCMHS